jgi:hypothetical protein
MDPTQLPPLASWRELADPEGARRAADALQAALPQGEAAHLLVLGAVLLAGIVLCFRGHRVFRLLVFLVGFALVGAGAAGIGHGELGWEGGPLLALFAISGVAGGLLALLVFYLSVFGLGAACAGALAWAGAGALGLEPGPLVVGVPALLGGAGALFVQRPVICLLTAVQGASVVVLVSADRLAGGDGLGRLLSDPQAVLGEALARPALVAAWVGLALVGAVAQVSSRRKRRLPAVPAGPVEPATA